ncbi:hypothetical protein AM571_PA00213 (plasmid) [Rhizobium etli 8C-3]|uniref:Uncharacterized protein n=1 Tax=Rhizobium etli 8C-3 TaxID=538025 RepID=A0A1L5PAA6_RHIET|nr:hypothetical protein AM571_PA00213 [Rhizobium etli 8C-3]
MKPAVSSSSARQQHLSFPGRTVMTLLCGKHPVPFSEAIRNLDGDTLPRPVDRNDPRARGANPFRILPLDMS